VSRRLVGAARQPRTGVARVDRVSLPRLLPPRTRREHLPVRLQRLARPAPGTGSEARTGSARSARSQVVSTSKCGSQRRAIVAYMLRSAPLTMPHPGLSDSHALKTGGLLQDARYGSFRLVGNPKWKARLKAPSDTIASLLVERQNPRVLEMIFVPSLAKCPSQSPPIEDGAYTSSAVALARIFSCFERTIVLLTPVCLG
jgi:hypothetical protein